MPRGWYLAQGLIPLSASSSEDDEGPCELPDGRFVCGPHGLSVCGKCCRDYTFMNEDVSSHDSDDEDEDEDGHSDDLDSDVKATDAKGPKVAASSSAQRSHNRPVAAEVPENPGHCFGPVLKRGTGQVFPTKYVLPSDRGKALIHTDGACLNNGQPDPRAGWAFWHGSNVSGTRLFGEGRLERKGPFGDDSLQTSNRAELRAVIAALRFRHWPGEGFHTVVIATDSEYVVEGCTTWIVKWVRNGRKTSGTGAAEVKNRDLWEALLGEVERFKGDGMDCQFWRIPREWNTVVDARAKEAAAETDVPDRWRELFGLCI